MKDITAVHILYIEHQHPTASRKIMLLSLSNSYSSQRGSVYVGMWCEEGLLRWSLREKAIIIFFFSL